MKSKIAFKVLDLNSKSKRNSNKDSSPVSPGFDFRWVFSICVLHATWLPQSTGPVNVIQMQITAIKSCWSWANILCQASKRECVFSNCAGQNLISYLDHHSLKPCICVCVFKFGNIELNHQKIILLVFNCKHSTIY